VNTRHRTEDVEEDMPEEDNSGTVTVSYREYEGDWIVETTFPQVGNITGYKTKAEAVEDARSYVGEEEGDQLVIHKKNGDVQHVHDY
jgi:hypothetical protein